MEPLFAIAGINPETKLCSLIACASSEEELAGHLVEIYRAGYVSVPVTLEVAQRVYGHPVHDLAAITAVDGGMERTCPALTTTDQPAERLLPTTSELTPGQAEARQRMLAKLQPAHDRLMDMPEEEYADLINSLQQDEFIQLLELVDERERLADLGCS